MTPLGVAIALGLVNLLVVCGNFFVLYILISQKSLHTSTNFIVLSLTVSDFLLGIIVLPFSIFQEYSDSWMFGGLWCKTWLALDVLFSTASIYNLLAISFDRYMAVRQPIKYRFISSNRMTKITIAIVWLISSALAFPPLIYDHFGQIDPNVHGNFTEQMGLPPVLIIGHGECTPMTSNNFYILFSAFVSFILPMFLMIGLNLSIFHTVSDSRKLTKIQSNGTSVSNLQYCGAAPSSANHNDEASWMRVHRGGAKNSAYSTKTPELSAHMSQRSASMSAAATLKKISIIQRDASSAAVPRAKPSLPSTRKTTFDYGMSLDKGGDAYSLASTTLNESGALLPPTPHHYPSQMPPTPQMDTLSMTGPIGVATSVSMSEAIRPQNAAYAWWIRRMQKRDASPLAERKQVVVEIDQQSFHSVATLNSTTTPTTLYPYNPVLLQKSVVSENVWYPALLTSILAAPTRRSTGAFGKKSSERLLVYPMLHQLTRFNLRTELRVARTIGVVVGCFTICWLPFTVIYVLQAFETCPVGICVPPWMFTLAFWLGYANSALNPLLYAAFSRDFRSAFRKVLTDRNSSFRSY